jgi:hypothetical protein
LFSSYYFELGMPRLWLLVYFFYSILFNLAQLRKYKCFSIFMDLFYVRFMYSVSFLVLL